MWNAVEFERTVGWQRHVAVVDHNASESAFRSGTDHDLSLPIKRHGGSGDTWVTVTGTNFLPNSWTSINSFPNQLVTEYVSSTQLNVLVPVNTISTLGGGTLLAWVLNPRPSRGAQD